MEYISFKVQSPYTKKNTPKQRHECTDALATDSTDMMTSDNTRCPHAANHSTKRLTWTQRATVCAHKHLHVSFASTCSCELLLLGHPARIQSINENRQRTYTNVPINIHSPIPMLNFMKTHGTSIHQVSTKELLALTGMHQQIPHAQTPP